VLYHWNVETQPHVTNAASAQALLKHGIGLLTLVMYLIRNRKL
jgi:hypothetical protein